MRLGCGVLVLAVATSAAYSMAAPAASERSLVALAEAYRSGDRQWAVATVGLWSREDVEKEVDRLAPLLAGADPATTARRRASVALLTESALLDLRVGAFPPVRWKLQRAALLVEVPPFAARGSAFERRFYLLAALALHCGGHLDAGYALLLRARKVLEELGDRENDPELLTAMGGIIEEVAALRTYDRSPDSRGRPPRPGGYATESGGAGSLPGLGLADAEARYQKALEIDPGLAEARLRLGRVRLLRGRSVEALRDLERVGAEAREPGQRYLARLFAGRARETRGDLAGAAAAYRAAAEHVTSAQTAFVALGHALDRLGDTAGAQEALELASSGGSRLDRLDPWMEYQVGQPARLDELLEELRSLIP